MSEQLLIIKAFLESKGLKKEAEEIRKISQSFPPMDASLENALEGIRKALYAEVDAKISELKEVADAKPESYKGSKESWLYSSLSSNPIKIIYPKKTE